MASKPKKKPTKTVSAVEMHNNNPGIRIQEPKSYASSGNHTPLVSPSSDPKGKGKANFCGNEEVTQPRPPMTSFKEKRIKSIIVAGT